MLVIVMDDRILSPQAICQNCLLADRTGQPRWRHGQLSCGHAVRNFAEGKPTQYECEMGFRVTNID